MYLLLNPMVCTELTFIECEFSFVSADFHCAASLKKLGGR